MSEAGKSMQRQFKQEETRGNIAHPGGELENLVRHTMGPGSCMSQDRYGDSFEPRPITPSRSDVFGKEATNQGLRLSKPGR
jgi:hypothetical protein